MEADIIRLLLFLAGVALVVGIYLWDRYKRVNGRVTAIQIAQKRRRAMGREEPGWRSEDGEGVDSPSGLAPLTAFSDEITFPTTEPSIDAENLPDDTPPKRKELKDKARVQDPPRPKPRGPQRKGAPQRKSAPPPEPPAAVPPMIIQINVVTPGEPFPGEKIAKAAQQLGLMFGEMNIFHRREGKSSNPVFSMASMVEPGSFPIKQMSQFSTPGLLLFAQLPGPKDSLSIFSEMLSTAERLSKLLGGELQDGSHSALSNQTIEAMREEILEHRRQVRLARIKK